MMLVLQMLQQATSYSGPSNGMTGRSKTVRLVNLVIHMRGMQGSSTLLTLLARSPVDAVISKAWKGGRHTIDQGDS